MRWLILFMWIGAVMGMAIYGMREEQNFTANQLHLLFIPIMTCYGFAFLLVLWNRLEIDLGLARIGFLVLLFLLCGWPMIYTLTLAPKKSPIRWPPYIPPYIAVLNDWMGPETRLRRPICPGRSLGMRIGPRYGCRKASRP